MFYDLVYFVSKSKLPEYLLQLLPYEVNPHTERVLREQFQVFAPDPFSYVKNTPIRDIVTDFPKFLERIQKESLDDEERPENMAKFYLCRNPEEGILVLAMSTVAQRAFQLTFSGEYLMLFVGIKLDKSQDFIPRDHQMVLFLREVTQILQPLYGYIEGEWVPNPRYILEDYPELGAAPAEGCPWWIPCNTKIVGESLAHALKRQVNLDYLCQNVPGFERWGENLYFFSSIATVDDWYTHRLGWWHEVYAGTELGEKYSKAKRNLEEALQNISVSELLNQSG
ncbi:MAG: hypothetical protein KatS3mg070_2090 [Meiothermus sp.]|uniref:hypothetical protein n=1 Tax=Meiothermus sp. TaxID=1955249 RepID=UPI0021DC38BC|nr:hypothetical protein [Meiothermus sp.]GIW28727.1 MAG: hypothetical protein KatS3mg070_2090 [Meiothermus sp.]